MTTRIRRLVAVMFASGAIGGVLAAPASADAPGFIFRAHCEIQGAPANVIWIGGPGSHRVILSEFAQGCDPGTLRVSVEQL